ncbi:MAG TPA: hypothetical protein V6D17_09390 [Candidatus Obscuribacterales bacterium]
MNIIGMETGFVPMGVAEPIKDGSKNAQAASNDRMLAASPHTAPTILEALAHTASPIVLELIATNPNTPGNVLAALSRHTSAQVRVAVAENKNTPLEIIGDLIKDDDADVRFGLAENPLLPEQILKELTEDDNPYVVSRAQKTLERIQAERSRCVIGGAWGRFRERETRRRLTELCDEASMGPINQINRFFANLYSYARAF